MNKTTLAIPAAILLFSACVEQRKENDEPQKPNIVYILADDLGIGDLSCYGQTLFKTPNIDKLSEKGIKFTQHYSGSTVCAPSRSALLTGLHTGHTFIRGNKSWQPEGQYPLEDEAVTISESLREAGYVTGAFGKWGLGHPESEGNPLSQGFDVFYGYNCQSLAHNYYPYHLWNNQEKVILQGNTEGKTGQYAPYLIHEQALNFIEENSDKPFFMFYPSIIPHAELLAPEEYMEKHRGKYPPEKQYKGVDAGERFRQGPYGSQPEAHAAFAALINLLDDQVGEIVNKLEELNLLDNTIIIFTSDNGPHMEGGADPDYFNSNGIFKGYKRDLYEGGIRVPMIAMWQNKITAGTETSHISAFWDVFPTISEITGAKAPESMDGISFLPALLGNQKQQENHHYLYWEFHELGGRQAIRKEKWKFIKNNIFNPDETFGELFNLDEDPGEEKNLSKVYPEIVQELESMIEKEHTESEIFPFKKRVAAE